MEEQSSSVAATPTQGEETPARWVWVEPSVWSERMLAALDNGVNGGKWFSLIDKVCKKSNLEAAWQRVYANRGGSGVDGMTVHEYQARWQRELECLYDLLTRDRYVPQPVRRVMIPKPGSREKRPLGIPAVRDRVVQTALRHVLEPIFERDFAEHSYGFRLDWLMASKGWEMVRYADDFVILCRSREEAENALSTVRGWVAEAGLTLHDGWIRRRLRTILNRREGRSRWAHTHADHRRWNNAFFQAQGLFSLAAAHAAECQSLSRR